MLVPNGGRLGTVEGKAGDEGIPQRQLFPSKGSCYGQYEELIRLAG